MFYRGVAWYRNSPWEGGSFFLLGYSWCLTISPFFRLSSEYESCYNMVMSYLKLDLFVEAEVIVLDR